MSRVSQVPKQFTWYSKVRAIALEDFHFQVKYWNKLSPNSKELSGVEITETLFKDKSLNYGEKIISILLINNSTSRERKDYIFIYTGNSSNKHLEARTQFRPHIYSVYHEEYQQKLWKEMSFSIKKKCGVKIVELLFQKGCLKVGQTDITSIFLNYSRKSNKEYIFEKKEQKPNLRTSVIYKREKFVISDLCAATKRPDKSPITNKSDLRTSAIYKREKFVISDLCAATKRPDKSPITNKSSKITQNTRCNIISGHTSQKTLKNDQLIITSIPCFSGQPKTAKYATNDPSITIDTKRKEIKLSFSQEPSLENNYLTLTISANNKGANITVKW
jgi:hypothetical protein